MKREFNVHVANEIVSEAEKAGIKLVMPVKNSVEMQIKDTAIPDRTGICIGKGDNENMESYIKNDDSCEELKKYIELGLVETKIFCQRIDDKLCDVPHYFFMYEVDESLANRPTHTEDSCGVGTPITGHYDCEYEILLGSEEYTRRMLFKTSSVNISMYEWIKDLEDQLYDLDDAEDEIKSQFFKAENEESEETWMFTMFDNVGLQTDVEVDTDEFLSMIVGIRQLSCTFVDSEKVNI